MTGSSYLFDLFVLVPKFGTFGLVIGSRGGR